MRRDGFPVHFWNPSSRCFGKSFLRQGNSDFLDHPIIFHLRREANPPGSITEIEKLLPALEYETAAVRSVSFFFSREIFYPRRLRLQLEIYKKNMNFRLKRNSAGCLPIYQRMYSLSISNTMRASRSHTHGPSVGWRLKKICYLVHDL